MAEKIQKKNSSQLKMVCNPNFSAYKVLLECHAFICLFSIIAFMLPQQSGVVLAEILWPSKLKGFTVWCLIEKRLWTPGIIYITFPYN